MIEAETIIEHLQEQYEFTPAPSMEEDVIAGWVSIDLIPHHLFVTVDYRKDHTLAVSVDAPIGHGVRIDFAEPFAVERLEAGISNLRRHCHHWYEVQSVIAEYLRRQAHPITVGVDGIKVGLCDTIALVRVEQFVLAIFGTKYYNLIPLAAPTALKRLDKAIDQIQDAVCTQT